MMKNNTRSDLISVIIPVYNVSKYLDKCLGSICGQTYKNIEIIAVNDGSTDDSLAKLEQWKSRDERVILINKQNGGLSSARNAGIDIATGKYITFIDGDDFVDERLIEELHEIITKYDKKISICNRYYYFEDGTKKLRFKDDGLITSMSRKESFINLLNMINFDMSAWGKMYDRSLFSNIRFPEGKLCEDYYIMYQLFSKSDGIAYTSAPLVYYLQQRKGSITRKSTIIYDYVYACEKQMNYICENCKELASYAKSAYCLSYYTVYNKALMNNASIDRRFLKDMKTVTKENWRCVASNQYISKTRKAQIIVFRFARILYRPLLKIYKSKEM
jgi:glycosyltransferase involved in cell wall biosynthesis